MKSFLMNSTDYFPITVLLVAFATSCEAFSVQSEYGTRTSLGGRTRILPYHPPESRLNNNNKLFPTNSWKTSSSSRPTSRKSLSPSSTALLHSTKQQETLLLYGDNSTTTATLPLQEWLNHDMQQDFLDFVAMDQEAAEQQETTTTTTTLDDETATYQHMEEVVIAETQESSTSVATTTTTTFNDTTLSKVPSYKSMFALMGATILIWLSEPLLSLVDTTVVSLTQGSRAIVQLASLGPATTLMDSLLWGCLFLSIATTNLISKGLAERNYKELQKTTSHLLGTAVVMGLLVMGIVYGTGPTLLKGMAGQSASPELILFAARYSQIRALVAPFSVLGMVCQSFCLANLNTLKTAIAVVVASVVNLSGDLLLSRFGVVGAAIATAVASVSSSLVLLQAVHKKVQEWRRLVAQEEEEQQQQQQVMDETTTLDLKAFSSRNNSDMEMMTVTTPTSTKPIVKILPPKQQDTNNKIPFMSLPDRKSFWNLVKLSGPLCFNMWAKIACYSALTIRATDFGMISLAAHNIMMRIFFFFGCFADSLGQTAQAFLPATLYPKHDKVAFRKILQRLAVLGTTVAVVTSQLSCGLLRSCGSALAKDAGIVQTMKNHNLYLGLSLLLHPFIVLLEGTVIATRDFFSLVMTYAVAVTLHFGILKFGCGSFAGVWRSLFWFQIARLGNFMIWGKRNKPTSEQA